MANDVSLAFNIIGRDRGASQAVGRVGREIRTASIIAAAAQVALGAAMASTAAHAIALGSAVLPAVGVIALVPGAAFAAVAGISVLAMAMGGLKDAFKAASAASSGGGASIAGAERRIASAQREVLAAQKALNDARKAAAERIDDLARTLAGARLDEESAVLAVAEAERDLREARRSGTPMDIRRAELAYRQSVQTVEDVRDRLADLAEEQQDAAAKGVEGSDEVEAALQRQASAVEALAAAQQSVGAGGVNKLAEAMAKLSPAGRELVTTVRALTPAWLGLRQAAQQSVLEGAPTLFRAMSAVWLPVLHVRLTQVGRAWNTAFRQVSGLATSRGFVADIDAALGNTATTMDRLGRAITPILSGLRHFAAVGSAILPGIAGSTLSIAQRFERWAAAARESGRMHAWMTNALAVLKQLWSISVNVAASVVAIFRAGSDSGATLASLERGAAAMRAWLESAQGQQQVASVLAGLRSILASLGDVIPNLAQAVPVIADMVREGGAINDTFKVMGTVMGFLAEHVDTVAILLPYLAAGFVAVKLAQVAGNAAMVIGIPLRIVEIVQSIRLTAAMRAHTAALAQNTGARGINTGATAAGTAAENVGILARGRAIVAMAAQKVAMLAVRAATIAWTAVQWALNIALTANPIGLIIIAIAALVAGIILAYRNSETFRKVVQAAWEGIKVAAEFVIFYYTKIVWPAFLAVWRGIAGAVMFVWDVYTTVWGNIIKFVIGLPGRITTAAKGMWDGIVNTFRGAINFLISLWNRLDFGINIRVPDWVPGVGGKGFSVPDLFPDLPMLASGGVITSAGMAVVGERGPEVVRLDRGAQVSPLGQASGQVMLALPTVGDDRATDLIVYLLRRAARSRGRGSIVRLIDGPAAA